MSEFLHKLICSPNVRMIHFSVIENNPASPLYNVTYDRDTRMYKECHTLPPQTISIIINKEQGTMYQ